jgi:hypothetical protein
LKVGASLDGLVVYVASKTRAPAPATHELDIPRQSVLPEKKQSILIVDEYEPSSMVLGVPDFDHCHLKPEDVNANIEKNEEACNESIPRTEKRKPRYIFSQHYLQSSCLLARGDPAAFERTWEESFPILS